VVATVDLGCPIDLKQLYDTVKILLNPFIQYDEFPEMITLHVPHTKAFGRIFRTGKMTCQGEISDEGCIEAAQKIAHLVQQMGYPVNIIYIQFIIYTVLNRFQSEFYVIKGRRVERV